MYFTHNLYSFVNYCFLGITEFGEKNWVISFYEITYLIIAVATAVLILILINYKKTNTKIEKEAIGNLKILLSFGIPMLFISYPILNYYHSTLSGVIIIISFLYTNNAILCNNRYLCYLFMHH